MTDQGRKITIKRWWMALRGPFRSVGLALRGPFRSMGMALLAVALCAVTGVRASERPMEMRADRIVIYPQRMELTGEESVMDILLRCPDLMQTGFASMVESYNVRMDNSPVNLDNRLFLNQLRASIVSKIQVCDNTAVAKGTIGLGRVIDITLVRLADGLHGLAEGQLGTDHRADALTELRYGSRKTDVYASASYGYSDQDGVIGQREQLFAHMTNWFSPRDRLLTYVNQQYFDTKDYTAGRKTASRQERYLARARYFHTFNDAGTELLVVGGYQWTNVPRTVTTDNQSAVLMTASDVLLGIVELNTPLGRGLTMMLGWEGDAATSRLRLPAGAEQKYSVANNDLYLQYNLTMGRFLLTLGDRVMFYRYGVGGQSHHDTRNNIEASAIATLSPSSQAQLAYHRKFTNPAFSFSTTVTEEEWLLRKGSLKAAYIDEVKLGYTLSRPTWTLAAATYLLDMDGADNIWKLQGAASVQKGWFGVTAGANYYNVKGAENDFATFHVAPSAALPHGFRLSAQAIFATRETSLAHGEQTYLALQAAKQLGRHFRLKLDWHDIASSHYSACMASVQMAF